MTPTQLIRLATVVIVGLFWIGLGQDLLFQNLLADLFAGPGVTLGTLFQSAVNPAFQALWVSCMIGTLIWFWMTYKTRPSGAQQAVTIRKIGHTQQCGAFRQVQDLMRVRLPARRIPPCHMSMFGDHR